MAAADQDIGSAPAAAPALKRQMSYTCSRGRAEPMHDRKLSHSCSFSTPAASPSSSSSPPPSSKSSCESIPIPDLNRESSFSSACSYESFYQIEAAAEKPGHDHECSSFHEFVPAATQPPAVQTMMAQGQPAGVGYDPKRLPSSMFRTRSTCPAEWSATSNESLFSIQLGHSGEVGDLYYDAAGVFHRLSSAGRDEWSLTAVSEASSSGSSRGGLCVRDDCARCTGTGLNRKSVRFAAAESVSGEWKHSPTLPTLAATVEEEEEAPATEAKAPEAAAEGWCVFGCCWPSTPSLWWPRCECCGCDCRCGC